MKKLLLVTFVWLSSAFFVQAAELNILTPNGGEYLKNAQIYRISWTPIGAKSVSISRACSSCGNFYTIAQDLPDTGYFDWKVGGGPNTLEYRINISATLEDGTAVSDETDANFTIQKWAPTVIFFGSFSEFETNYKRGSLYAGNTDILEWRAENAVSCQASGGWSGEKPVSGKESTGSLTSETTYILTCQNADGVSYKAGTTIGILPSQTAPVSVVETAPVSPVSVDVAISDLRIEPSMPFIDQTATISYRITSLGGPLASLSSGIGYPPELQLINARNECPSVFSFANGQSCMQYHTVKYTKSGPNTILAYVSASGDVNARNDNAALPILVAENVQMKVTPVPKESSSMSTPIIAPTISTPTAQKEVVPTEIKKVQTSEKMKSVPVQNKAPLEKAADKKVQKEKMDVANPSPASSPPSVKKKSENRFISFLQKLFFRR